MAWTGNKTNNPPDPNQQNQDRSNVLNRNLNRAEQVRRDTDKRKNFTVSLLDIDGVVMSHLSNHLQLSVVDDGQKIKVPVIYASPELWKSIQKDGVFRDYNGKIQLPVLAFHRISTERNTGLATFHQHLKTAVIRLFSSKNRYTRYNLLNGQNAPVNEVYNVAMPTHVTCTYTGLIWTEYIEQNNKILEDIYYSSRNYWGDKNGFRFRANIENFSHTNELTTGVDRMIKTEFSLIISGYLLPESAQLSLNEGIKETTIKSFTPKKIVLGMEVVSTGTDLNKNQPINFSKYVNQQYPNLDGNTIIPEPGVKISSDVEVVENQATQVTSSL